MALLRGTVQSVLYSKEGYHVLAMTVHDTEPPVGLKAAKAAGPLHGIANIRVRVPIELHGDWTDHRKYGQQFTITSWRPWTMTPQDIARFLMTCIQGLHDPELSLTAVEQWGDKTFQRLEDTDPLGNTRLAVAREYWQQAVAFRDMAELLRDDGLSSTLVSAILSKFGVEARRVLTQDPYRILEIPGIDFAVADRMGLRLGVPPSDVRRTAGAVLCALRAAIHEGHLFVPRGDLATWARDTVSTITDVEPALNLLQGRRSIIIVPGTGAYLPEWHHYEQTSAAWLADRPSEGPLRIDAESFIKGYEQTSLIELSEDQRQALRLLATNRVLVLTGLPGTGKTTVVRAFVRMFEAAKIDFLLMAPTGIAAKRLAAVTERPASTIHRALRYDGMTWGHDTDNRLVISAVIVDEMSMVDQELLYRLLSALRPDTLVVFVGDDAQLPSVGPGFVLRELVTCPALARVRLTTIFRQSDKGDIVLNAHRVNRGEMLLAERAKDSEFQVVRSGDEERIASLIIEMSAKLKGRNANFQVLSPKYDGVLGVTNLNERLRDRLNPAKGQQEFHKDSLHFRVGDRLMVVQNDYQLSVYNGDVGKLTRVTETDLYVRIHGTGLDPDMEVKFPVEHADRLRLAYAVTVHKCQGSEFDTIILPVVSSHGRMLQRNLFYTAITRARKRVWVLGEDSAVLRAIQNATVQARNTRLSECIVTCRDGVDSPHG